MSNDPDAVERLSLDAPVALLRKMNHDIRNPLNAVLATANKTAAAVITLFMRMNTPFGCAKKGGLQE